jgi:AraC-like DNA-binding protein
MPPIRIREGFQGQKQWVIPKATLDRWSTHPMLGPLIPTDIGWYPTAKYHYREREQGADEHILIFCTEGEGWYEIGGQHEMVQPNEALLIPRGTPHIYGASDEFPWSIQWVHFYGTEADFFMLQLPLGEYKLLVDPECAATIDRLFRECYHSFVGGFIMHRLVYCAQVLRHLLGCLFFNNNHFSPGQRTSRFHSIEPTLAFLHQNMGRNLTLKEMAVHAGLSSSHFSFLFKQQTGYSPMDYFIHLKMQHACTLLSLTRKTIHEIAYEIGYDDPYYFSRIFKKVMGISPRQYRESPTG